jgi:hypothetical protein
MLKPMKIALCFILSFAITPCFSDGLEFGGVYQYNSSGNTTFDSSGSKIKLTVASYSLGGLNAGYNLKYASLYIDFLFGATSITMGSVIIKPTIAIANVGLDIYPMATPLKPMISASIGGLTYASSLISSEGLNETDDIFSLGAGFRWDAPHSIFIKGQYKVSWHSIQDTDGSIFMQGLAITAGYLIKFKKNNL